VTTKVRVGEGSGAVLIFFVWLLVALLLTLHVSYGVGALYIIISFVVAFAFQEAINEMKLAVFISRQAKAFEEKQFSVGPFSIIILRGPVKITAARIAILFGVMGAGFGVLLLFMALGRPDPNSTSITPISIGVLLTLIVINFLEVRWRKPTP
jgi:hypothetical protein